VHIENRSREHGWRAAGRPPRKLSPELIAILHNTYGTDQMGVFTTEGATDSEIRQFLAALKSAGRQLDASIRIQKDLKNGEIRFYMEDK
jgi:hypothetical protein